MNTHKYYGKTLWEWFGAYEEHFKDQNEYFPSMELKNKSSEELARMAKEAIETDTPIEIEYDPFIMY
ncbi:hypothetical protein B8A39_06665 [Dolosigranulum pigrum]|jgi:hypothetical protein|uniref:hypothetical protein n=1 Tax=Dolosigranulum pigrum TaxID=29394 RepID=UPI000DBF53B6|nr:hypothetical protein [Dolosigranulum pigrum]QTJ57583.1 hypothetical protein FE335_08980 [Dolosigranulum pigrum]RAN51520.1 hypothetical protein B8A39_06665 [Dolosigranulum pigrum]DAP94016.1 MAG TPA: hypothetical protein [Caudoviricetes sp.]